MYVYPVVAAEFSNWRDEQKAWRDSAVLFDQSHHMDEVIVEGPDAERFLQGLAINSFKGFGTNRAKHFVPVSPEGYVIGDMICFREREDRFVLVGRAPTANWVEYNGTLGTHDVKVTRDPRSPSRPDGNRVERVHYRFQIQGPDAPAIFEKLNGGPIPDIGSSMSMRSPSPGARCRRCGTAWPGRPASRSGGPTRRRTRSGRRSCRRRRRRAPTCARSDRAPIRRTRSSRVDPVAAAGDLHEPRAQGVPRVARRRQLRGDRVDRRQLRLGRHPRLLHLALRARLRHLHRSSTTTSSGARRSRR